MSKNILNLLGGLLLVGPAIGQQLPEDFVVVDLREDEINYYGVDNRKVGTLTRAEHAAAPGEVTVIGYTPDQMKAQLQIPGRGEEYIFVLATDIRVEPGDVWEQATTALADFKDEEGFCLGAAKPAPAPRGPDERTHAPHALFSCR
jgi:hypothetical protein